ncbi:50S ribosomal protein L5 [Buchnera aphidicola (Mollitrichosiphum nigrofasciatum)]|uniref:50S ribosomal protein L5 n=1 Tax=Buchnera aphidicola TaxID=9 RepID=UPI0031B8AE6E
MSILYIYYKNKVVSKLMRKFNYGSVMQVPKIEKITLNMGVGLAITNKKLLKHAISDLTLISGQKPVITKAKSSISGFKIRKGNEIGCKVTLRGFKKWNFLYKLITIAIPRIRDFRGFFSKSFDGRGNYSLGIREQIIFPEIDYDKIDQLRGMDITITTSTNSDKEAYALLSLLNFPFRNKI